MLQKMSGLNNRNYFLTVQFKIKETGGAVSDGDSVPDSQMATFSLCPYMCAQAPRCLSSDTHTHTAVLGIMVGLMNAK
jgi:hypothetical protein